MFISIRLHGRFLPLSNLGRQNQRSTHELVAFALLHEYGVRNCLSHQRTAFISRNLVRICSLLAFTGQIGGQVLLDVIFVDVAQPKRNLGIVTLSSVSKGEQFQSLQINAMDLQRQASPNHAAAQGRMIFEARWRNGIEAKEAINRSSG